MAYKQGVFEPRNPKKYTGTLPIIYRSGWELELFQHLDEKSEVVAWSSESVIIPYQCPSLNPRTGKITHHPRRYFPDVWVKFKDGREMLIEVKPKKETVPPKMKTRKTKKYLTEVSTYIVNDLKWKAARAYCKAKGIEFAIFTEEQIFGRMFS